MADFEDRKSRALAGIESDTPDRSRKGGIDAPIATLISRVNAHPDFFTTSSCSGRITLFTEPASHCGNAEENNAGKNLRKKKKGGEWVLVSHEPLAGDDVVAAARGFASGGNQDLLVFRFEPFILALDCVSVAAAQELVACAIASGFRESGISGIKKRVMVAIRCSIRLEVPVAEKGGLLVSDEYLIYLTTLANRKMEQNKLRTEKFLDSFISQFQSGASSSLDSIIEVTNDEHFKAGDTNGGNVHEEVAELGCLVADKNDLLQDERKVEKIPSFRTHTGWIDETPGSLLHAEPVCGSDNPGILQRWGHSSCSVGSTVMIFGGYGGAGRHARLDDIVLYSPRQKKLEQKILKLSPRMAHSASSLNGKVWIIGGRRGPLHVLGDVLVIDTRSSEPVSFPAISGASFTARHRHAAAVVDDKIYIYGGLGDGGALLGDFFVLDTISPSWSEIKCTGEFPPPRHSHTLSAVGSKLYLIGGFDGKKVCGDIHVFDTQTSAWSRVSTRGDAPVPRFSHSSTVIVNHIAVLGGCPTIEQRSSLFLLDVSKLEWSCFKLSLPDETLLVRHASSLVDGFLVVTGGGASCYAFGTMFSSSFLVDLKGLNLH